MLGVLTFYAVVALSQCSFIVKPGPLHPATSGEMWPKPQKQTHFNLFYKLEPLHLTVEKTGQTCQILENAIRRYGHILSEMYRLVEQPKRPSEPGAAPPLSSDRGTLTKLNIALSEPCEEYPHLDMQESYNLTVLDEATISSTSIWGIIRGLESFSQLVYVSEDFTELRINQTVVSDFPRYAHRGLLLDTSRHYISVLNILKVIDAMAYNKLNVFHWHIVDDQSFPYQSINFPDLSARGAYHPRAVYTQDDIAHVIKHARDRGVRVLPEFDMPGHTRSWGEGYPAVLTACYSGDRPDGNLGPMDPTSNQTYQFLHELLAEVGQVFPERYLHIGGDEVDRSCWLSNPHIQSYMSEHGVLDARQLHALFMSNVLPQLPMDTSPIVWQEVVDDGVQLPKGTLVQIWKSSESHAIRHVIGAGYRVLFSSCWYLDHLNSGGDWEKFYDCDPRHILGNDQTSEEIVGGEACMWDENVDDFNVISRIWPRASAVAEKLWSPAAARSEEVVRRLEEHTCRMNRRGIAAQPASGPGYCVTQTH